MTTTPYSYDRTASLHKIALSVGETFENELWRIHRYAEHLNVTSLSGAGKRGGKCVQWVLFGRGGESQAMEFTMMAKRNVSFDRMNDVIDDAKEAGTKVEVRWLKGVDVKPGNFQKIVIRGIHLTAEADYDSYSIKDIDDENNEPTCIARGKKSVYQFYRWLRDNASAMQRMTFAEACEALKSAGIDYHQYCAVD